MVSSELPDANVQPSGLNATEWILLLCPRSVCREASFITPGEAIVMTDDAPVKLALLYWDRRSELMRFVEIKAG
jgi:hypothetical protein